jgi:GLPGLI family protein
MKFTVIFFFIYISSYAQKLHIFCQYKETYTPDSLKRERKKEDLMGLEIDAKQSRFYSINSLNQGKAIESQMIETGKVDMTKISIPSGASTVIYQQFDTHKFTTFERMGSGSYQFSESSPVFNWAISTDTMTIAKHLCQKATTTFRGRSYTAWFALDISLPYGPWKFGGLPGLILAIEDSKKDYAFSCTEVSKIDSPIEAMETDALKVSKADYKRLYLVYLQDPMQFFAKGAITMTTPVPNPVKKPHNPIELSE